MQLLLKRGQNTAGVGRPKFTLWAKFDLAIEEQKLIDQYRVWHFPLTEGDPLRDLLTAVKWGAGLTAFVFLIAFYLAPNMISVIFLAGVAFAGGTFGIYHQLREEIRVSDMLTGRTFACRSVITLLEKERTISEMAHLFREFLEAMKNWGGTEVIRIEPGQKPVVELAQPRAVA